jgi:hypothetical protein
MLAAKLEQSAAAGDAPAPAPKAEHKEAAAGGAATVAAFLKSPTGRRIEKEVIRGVFGLLKKSL